METNSTQLILASSSPRRAELLRGMGLRFEIRTPAVCEPEPRSRGQIPQHWAEALSYFKARSVAKELENGFVLGADTIVALGDQIIGKPADVEDARRILNLLVGTTHDVITGVTLLNVESGERLIRHDTTTLSMRPMFDDTLEHYLESGLWKGKAGAYGIQDSGDANIENMQGSYTNVVGLPTELVEQMCADADILDAIRA
jgi:septum formation protein